MEVVKIDSMTRAFGTVVSQSLYGPDVRECFAGGRGDRKLVEEFTKGTRTRKQTAGVRLVVQVVPTVASGSAIDHAEEKSLVSVEPVTRPSDIRYVEPDDTQTHDGLIVFG